MIVNRNSEDVSLKGEKISSCEDQHQTQYLAISLSIFLKSKKKKVSKNYILYKDMTSQKTVPKITKMLRPVESISLNLQR